MPSEEEVLEWARKMAEEYKKDLINASKDPDLDLSSKRREIEGKAEKRLDVYLQGVKDTHLRTIVYELVFTKTILKTYQELTKR